jgi:hypothetical protein
MDTNDLEILFGKVAMEKGFVTPEQIVEAKQVQIKETNAGRQHRYIGAILTEKSIMDLSQINEVLITMNIPPI